MVENAIIMGAAGRDFHNFNVLCRDDPGRRVVAFTAAQIPDIAGRRYPPELAGSLYPEGIPIVAEEDLERLVKKNAWAGVERTFVKCLATGVELDFEDWVAGAHAARALGDITSARERLMAAVEQCRADDGSYRIVNELTCVTARAV